MQDAGQIARALDDIALLMALAGENPFKIRAYERGGQIVADLGQDELARLIEEDRLTKVEGIGEGLAKQIVELWNSGSSSLLDKLRAENPPGAIELARLPGMTLRRMRALHETLGVSSIADLRAACAEQRVRKLPGFGAKTEQRLLDSAERALSPQSADDAPPARIVLGEALRIAERIARALTERGTAVAVHPAGAARRFEETLSELDLLIATRDPQAIWSHLLRMPLVARIDREHGTARLAAGIPMVIHFAPPERAAAALIFATGPDAHVHALQARAADRGLVFTRDGLAASTSPNSSADAATESAIYDCLGLPFIPPELRADPSALYVPPNALADLLAPEDIRGMVHCHTTYSDGKNSIEEMALAAEALGMHYITITDHSPSAHYAGGLDLDRLKQQWDEIAEVQERVRVRILRGTESDILADGALDHPDEVLEQLDVVIASVHSRFKLDRVKSTERLVRAMGLPVFKIWGHALGRMLLSRDPIDCDVPKVLDALAGSRGAIELNADPHRMDLPPQWIPEARRRGIPFVVSVDAHSTEGLRVLPLGVGMARRGGIRRGEVLNTLGAEEFAARVRPLPAG